MKTLQSLLAVSAYVFLTSCATTVTFPVSSIVPAAEIKAKKTQDKNNNYVIELTALNLADASRLNPPKKNYSVWIVGNNGQTKNVGKFANKNARKAYLKTVTPFNPKEIFITAEDEGNLNYPSGVEVSRTTF